MVPVALQPTGAVGDGRIGLLAARPRRDHVERIYDDDGSRRGRVLPAGHFDRQGVARVGKARSPEVFRLGYVLVGRVRGGSIGVNLLHEGGRSEEHTTELQSLTNIVCRLLLHRKRHTARSILSLLRYGVIN